MFGVIKWFSPIKGYGFIERADGPDIVFFRSDIWGQFEPSIGMRVAFEAVCGDRGIVAKQVRAVDPA